MNEIQPTFLRPFTRFCLTIGEIPTSYLYSKTYYEQVLWLCHYLQEKVIPAVNNNALALKEVQEHLTELQAYVDHYFENLDVQEEINNKLDEMAESGVLEALISDFIINGKGQVKYIFPSNTHYTSEFNLINGYDKNILIDCGRTNEYTNLTDTLTKYNIEHIDYLIITHFHTDHCQNLPALYTDGYCDETTTLILPHYNTSIWSSDSSYTEYNTIMQYLTTNNIPYTLASEGQTISINENFYVKIYNTNDTYYIDNNINDEYNNASLICVLTHFENHILYCGDAYKHALLKIYNDGVIPTNLKIYKNGHHGIDNRDLTIKEIIRHLTIENVVDIVGINDIDDGKCDHNGTLADLRTMTKNIYITAYNENNIQFSSFINAFNLDNGFLMGGNNNSYSDIDIYVDITNATDTQDGTQAHPFKRLEQALGTLEKTNGKNYYIHVANGTYSVSNDKDTTRPTLYGFTNKIKIEGETKAGAILESGFEIIDCSNVEISKFTIVNKLNARSFPIENSYVYLHDIDYDKNENTNAQYCIVPNKSHVIVENMTISNASFGINETDSDVELNNITFTAISNQCLYGKNGRFLRSDNLTITDSSVSHGRDTTGTKPLFVKGLTLFEGSKNYSDGNIALFARPARFTTIDVYYQIGSVNYTQSFIMNNSAMDCGISSFIVDNSNYDNYYSASIKLQDTYNLVWNNSRYSKTLRTDGTITFVNQDTTLTIKKVVAH